MYQTSTEFASVVSGNSRTFYAKIISGSDTITSGIKKYKYNGGSNGDDNITIGSTVSAYVEMEISNPEISLENKEIQLFTGLQLSSSIEYFPVGKFTVQKPEKDGKNIKITAYDKMSKAGGLPYFSDLTYPATAIQILDEICVKLGISRATTGLGTITILNKLEGYTCREAIGYIAALYGKFACINRQGNLEIRWYEDSGYSIGPGRYFTLPTNENNFIVNKIECSVDNSTTLTAGSGYTGISISNPLMTQDRLNTIYNALNGFTYRPGSCRFLGAPRLDTWDIITVTDIYGNVCKIPCMVLTQEYDGGISTTVEAKGKTQEESQNDFKGPTTKAVERTYAELMLVKTLLVDKANIEYLQANYATINSLTAVTGRVDTLETTSLTATQADIKYATISNLDAVTGMVQALESNSLTANSAVIQSLQSGVANINTLMFGTASGGSLTTEFSNSVVGLIGNAQIKDAMIESLNVSKINAGKISTNRFTVGSDSGNLTIIDNTIMIKDSTRTRVQIGKDASNDYNMYVWDASGNLMFDALGLTANGVTRKIIRDNVIQDNANINASKLDINSLFTQINGSANTIKSSKVYLDSTSQTLDVAFTSMTTSVSTAQSTANSALTLGNTNSTSINTLTTTINSQGTQLGVVQGQISSKVWSQDITTAVNNIQIGGRNITLNSNFKSGTGHWYGNNVIPTIESDDRFGHHAKIVSTGSGQGIYQVPGTVAGEVYSFSCWLKADADTTATIALEGIKDTICDLTTTWQLFKVEGAVATGNHATIIYPFHDCTFYIANVKFEKGNKCTDWTPAPEDIQVQINDNKFEFTNVVGCNVNGNIITKNIGTYNWGDAGISNTYKFNNGDSIEFKSIVGHSVMVGFSSVDSNQDFYTIQYAIFLNNNPGIDVYENGVNVHNIAGITWSTSDIFAIKLDNNKIEYYMNGKLFYTSLVIPTIPLVLDASLWEKDSSFSIKLGMTDSIKAYADTKKAEADAAAQVYAEAAKNAATVNANAYADGKVTTAEQNAINVANANLATAKIYSETKATEAKNASLAYTDAIQIGGRNLTTNYMKKMEMGVPWGSVAYDFVKDASAASGWRSDFTVTSVTSEGRVRAYIIPGYSNSMLFMDYKEYTISFKIKSSNAQIPMFMYYEIINKGINFTLTNDWQKVSITGISNGLYHALLLFIDESEYQTAGNKISICDLKLEEGNKPTDWTPAPEDVQTQIDTTNTNVTTLSNNYTTLNQTVSNLSATVSNNTTTIAAKADNSVVTTLSNTVTNIQADLTGYKTTVSNTYTTKTDFINLEIGGRNLLLGTEDFSTNLWNFLEFWTKDGNYNGFTVIKQGAWRGISQNISVTTGEIYTFSAWIKNGNNGNTYLFTNNDTGVTTEPSHYFGVITEWTRISITFTVTTSGAIHPRFENAVDDGWLYICGMKLEKGNKATDWTPAPEDIDSQIASVDNKFANYSTTAQMNSVITQSASSITQSVSATYVTQTNYNTTVTNLNASLSLKVDTANLVSSINASADVISLTSNRFNWTSTYSSMTSNGALTTNNLTVTGGIIKSSNYAYGVSGMKLDLANGTWDSKYTQISSTGAITCNSLTSSNVTITGGNIYLKTEDGTSAITLETFVTSGDKYQTSLEGHQVKWLNLTNGDYALIQPYGLWFKNDSIANDNAYLGRKALSLSWNGSYINANTFNAINPQGIRKVTINSSSLSMWDTSDNNDVYITIDGYAKFDQSVDSRKHRSYNVNGIIKSWFTDTDFIMQDGFNNNAVHFDWNGNGWLTGTLYTASGGVSQSDRNVKYAISQLDKDKSADFIYSLIPSEYKYTNGTSGRFHHGLIAQEVRQNMQTDWGLYVFDGIKAGLRYEELIADLICTIQSLNKRLKSLENTVNLN